MLFAWVELTAAEHPAVGAALRRGNAILLPRAADAAAAMQVSPVLYSGSEESLGLSAITTSGIDRCRPVNSGSSERLLNDGLGIYKP